MTKMLIDRAVVEQALHVATAAGHPVALIAALRASLADQQEPGFWGRVSARQASRIKQLEATGQQALEFIRTMNQQGWMLADYEDDMERTVAGLEAALAEPVKQCVAHGECFGGECIYQRPAEPVQKQAEPDSPERRCGGPGCDMTCCQPVGEPVVWMSKADIENPSGWRTVFLHTSAMATENSVPLYTAPPQRKPLSEEEIAKCWHDTPWNADLKTRVFAFARAIERALGIKE